MLDLKYRLVDTRCHFYGGNEGFNTVLDYCEDACEGLLEVVKKRASVYIPGSAL